MAEVIEPARSGLAARLGWRVERRPRPGFAHVLGAAAGAFVVVGVVAFVAEADDTTPRHRACCSRSAARPRAAARDPSARSAPRRHASPPSVLAVPLLWFFAFFGGGFGGGSFGQRRDPRRLPAHAGELRWRSTSLTWTKGRAIFLAGALLVFASWVTFEVGNATRASCRSRARSRRRATSRRSRPVATRPTARATAALILGLVFLGAGAALDRRGTRVPRRRSSRSARSRRSRAPIVLGGNDSLLLGGLLAIAAGAVVGLVGGHGDRRRATTWIGVLAVFGGCVAVISDIAPSSAAGVGGIAFGFALVLGSIAWWLAPVLGEPDDGDDRPRPTAPPGGSTEGRHRHPPRRRRGLTSPDPDSGHHTSLAH